MKILTALLLALSICVIPVAYEYADKERGYNSTGGEFFLLVLPFGIAAKAICAEEEKSSRIKEREYKYKKIKK